MFGKSYTDGAVHRASAMFKDFNYGFENRLLDYPVEGLPELSEIQIDGVMDALTPNSPRKEAAKKRMSFTNGALNAILMHYYDGKQSHFDAYTKKVFYEAFNEGFMRNYAKMLLKQYNDKKNLNPSFWVKGEAWGKEFINSYE